MQRVGRGAVWGALAGLLAVGPDGALLGVFLGDFWSWFIAGCGVGAALGLLIGTIAGAIGKRLVLPPPGDLTRRQHAAEGSRFSAADSFSFPPS